MSPQPEIDVSVSGVEEIQDRFDELAKRGGDIEPLGKEIGRIVGSAARRTFSDQAGGRWDELSDETLARKAREGLPSTPLVASGALRDSLAQGRLVNADDDRLEYGTDVFYARFLSSGAGGRGGIPPRMLVKLDPGDRAQILELIRRYVLG